MSADNYLSTVARSSHQGTSPAIAAKVTARRYEVAKLYLTGWRQPAIADHLGVNQAQISRDLAVIRRAWMKSAVMDFNEQRSQELAKIDALEAEYWEAWRRSQEDAEVRTTKARSASIPADEKKTNLPASDLEATTRIEGQAGDPRFLAGVQWCIERRCALLGLDQPKTIGVMIGNKSIDKASDTELTLFIVSEITALLQPPQQQPLPAAQPIIIDADSTALDNT